MCPIWGQAAGSPSNTMWPGLRPSTMPSCILIYSTVWPQYANVTDRQIRQRSDSIGRTVLQTVPRTTTTTTTVLPPFFRDHPSEPVPGENFWTLWCEGRLTEADTPTIQHGATPSGLTSAHLDHPPIFLQAGCPSCRPTNSVKALKATNGSSETHGI